MTTEDPARKYTPAELLRLTENLRAVTARVHQGDYRAHRFGLRLVQDLHASLFEGVRDHAGRFRQRGFGQEYLVFGPNRSAHRDVVEGEMRLLLALAARRLEQLLADPRATTYERDSIELAVETHAQIIGIHPFEDGNGRTSRLILGHILVAGNLRPIPVEAVKQEYNEALNRYFATRNAAEIVAFFLRLYPLAHEGEPAG